MGHQRQRMYRAQWDPAVASKMTTLQSLEEVKALVWALERLPCYPEHKRGLTVATTFQTKKAYYTSGGIFFPVWTLDGAKWAYSDLIVIHEVAHHLCTEFEGHGPVFCRWMLRLTRGIGRKRLAALLEDSFRRHGVDFLEETQPATV